MKILSTATALATWRTSWGDLCPGWRRDRHPSSELIASEWTPGDPRLSIVLCPACHEKKGDTVPTEDDLREMHAKFPDAE